MKMLLRRLGKVLLAAMKRVKGLALSLYRVVMKYLLLLISSPLAVLRSRKTKEKTFETCLCNMLKHCNILLQAVLFHLPPQSGPADAEATGRLVPVVPGGLERGLDATGFVHLRG